MIGATAGSNIRPLLSLPYHRAAVKAIAWSPHKRGVLASGGGAADTKISICDTLTGNQLNSVTTLLQVCGLVWNKHANEIASVQGQLSSEICLYRCPTFTRISSVTTHIQRAPYMAVSPDGSLIATASEDEQLLIWSIFPHAQRKKPIKVTHNAYSSFISMPQIR